jgi:hypothetical protein
VATVKHVAQLVAAYLIEGDDVDYFAKTFADRLVLRVFNAPALMTYLRNMAVLDSRQEGVSEGEYKFQLKFTRLPSEILPQVKQIIGVPNIRVVEFEEDHVSCTGFEFTLKREDLDFSQKKQDAQKFGPGKSATVFPAQGIQPPVVG